jgi:rhodanese-related sulfurtransferase
MYVICAGGGRSAAASKQLSDRGYLNVFNVEGGMKSWRGETVKD